MHMFENLRLAFRKRKGIEWEGSMIIEGYIQMNKQKPQNDGEAGEGWGGGAHNFPFIQITEAGEC